MPDLYGLLAKIPLTDAQWGAGLTALAITFVLSLHWWWWRLPKEERDAIDEERKQSGSEPW